MTADIPQIQCVACCASCGCDGEFSDVKFTTFQFCIPFLTFMLQGLDVEAERWRDGVDGFTIESLENRRFACVV